MVTLHVITPVNNLTESFCRVGKMVLFAHAVMHELVKRGVNNLPTLQG